MSESQVGAPSKSEGLGQGSPCPSASPTVLTSERIAEEIRRDDAAMADELRVLVPQRRGVCRRQFKTAASLPRESKTGAATSSLASMSSAAATRLGVATKWKGKSITSAVSSVKRKEVTETFIERKREMGLVRISLESKKEEIRKLDDAADRAEKQLRQKQDQLECIKEKFNSFLKSSSLEQDAAMRRVDFETKAKYEKMLEIKKLTARIGHIESEMRKIVLQLDRCKSYKEFLNGLTKPQWFYDVLFDLRLSDCTQKILQESEAEYAARSAELKSLYDEALPSDHQEGGSGASPPSLLVRTSTAVTTPSFAEKALSLSEQLSQLHASIQANAQQKAKDVHAQLQTTIRAMPLEEVQNILNTEYPESRMPLYFTDVNQLLDVFIDIEEGNLFLIQNCQELEEELEGVTISFVNEKNSLQTMVDQRHSQMSILQEKIGSTEEKLKELEDRIVALDKPSAAVNNGKPNDPNANDAKNQPLSIILNKNDSSAAQVYANLTPDEIKRYVDQIIVSIFRGLTTGDNMIKQLSVQQQRLQEREQRLQQQQQHLPVGLTEGGEKRELSSSKIQQVASSSPGGGGAPLLSEGKPPPPALAAPSRGLPRLSRKGSVHRPGRGRGQGQGGGTATGAGGGAGLRLSKSMGPSREGERRLSMMLTGGRLRALSHDRAYPRDTPALEEAGAEASPSVANMGPVEMLTIIENKLEEYNRYVMDPANGIEEGLIQSVIKAGDKERRLLTRLQLIAEQERAQEERVRQALERSNSPVLRRIGKPVLPRSHLHRDNKLHSGKVTANKDELEESIQKFFR